MQLINKYKKYKNIDSFFPKELDMSLVVCTKKCGRVYLEPTKFVHTCEDCGNKFKYLYHLKYELAEDINSEGIDMYHNYLIQNGNTDETLDWIDDITYDDLISGKVDCLGKIDIIYVAFMTCRKKCGYYGLVTSGSPQICPKCGKDCYRWKEVKYKLVKNENK